VSLRTVHIKKVKNNNMTTSIIQIILIIIITIIIGQHSLKLICHKQGFCNWSCQYLLTEQNVITSLQIAATLPSVYKIANAGRPFGRNNINVPCTVNILIVTQSATSSQTTNVSVTSSESLSEYSGRFKRGGDNRLPPIGSYFYQKAAFFRVKGIYFVACICDKWARSW